MGEVTDDEIDDFLAANPLMAPETAEALMDPGFLGFQSKFGRVRSENLEEFFEEFDESVVGWAENQTWIAADELNEMFAGIQGRHTPAESRIWMPAEDIRPSWIETSPSALLIARELLESGRLLSEMDWRKFEKLIAELLEREGWTVELLRGTKDGGMDVISTRNDPMLGGLKAVWQAKRYGVGKKVRLAQARELSGVVQREGVTKGVLVTTSSLTRGALDWIRQDEFRLEAKDGDDVRRWIEKHT
ncbi:MAG: restriction endonuclease [Bauldia litoralis]